MYKCLKLYFAVIAVCVLFVLLTGCKGKEKPANTQNKNNTSDTVSAFSESQVLKDGELSNDSAFSSEDKPLSSDNSELREDTSQNVEVTIEPESSLRVDTNDSALDTDEASSTDNYGNTDSVSNLWDSDGDGYYDIKIH